MMEVAHSSLRHNLQLRLLTFSDIGYQKEMWIPVREGDPEPIGFRLETEYLLNDIPWDFPEDAIGTIFRSHEEFDACLAVIEVLEKLLNHKGENPTAKECVSSPEWSQIVALARKALRFLNEGDA